MFKKFMADLINEESFKVVLTEHAMIEFAQEQDVILLHSPILYRLYTLYVGGRDKIESRPVFYRKVGTYLYYEKLTCKHGEEFYYYIKFNKDSQFYQEHRILIEVLALANDPMMLTDYIGTKDIQSYNTELKKKEKE